MFRCGLKLHGRIDNFPNCALVENSPLNSGVLAHFIQNRLIFIFNTIFFYRSLVRLTPFVFHRRTPVILTWRVWSEEVGLLLKSELLKIGCSLHTDGGGMKD